MNVDNPTALGTPKPRAWFIALWTALGIVCLGALILADRFPYRSLAFEILMRVPMVLPGLVVTVMALTRRKSENEPPLLRTSSVMFGIAIVVIALGLGNGPHLTNLARAGFILTWVSLALGAYGVRSVVNKVPRPRERRTSVALWLGLIFGGYLMTSSAVGLSRHGTDPSSNMDAAGVLLGAAIFCSSASELVRGGPIRQIIRVVAGVCFVAGMFFMW